ncbi:Callose synthase 9 [Triticum urartu]|uniref:1,3-beta-glucan synthase n=1 Tax=Triticum urartu TaxID=4572 RepID=M7ZA49_TRIUA|nr:Callose synthase 9 [Triticum urartu]
MKLRESGVFSGNLGELERKTLKRKKVLATLKVLWSVIEDITKEISPEDAANLISEEMKKVMQKDAARTEDVVAYNIIPLDSLSTTNLIVTFPEVRAAISSLQYHRDLPRLPNTISVPDARNSDMLDLLHCVFGFQKDNVSNQREHIVHLLANEQSRLGKLSGSEPLARELEVIMQKQTAEPAGSCISNDGVSFLDQVIYPLYEIVAAEAGNNDNGRAAHSAWRNYDDFNEFFWSEKCFQLGWPWKLSNPFFSKPNRKEQGLISRNHHYGKTSFVEHRTFLHLYHSFHRLWMFLLLMFQIKPLVKPTRLIISFKGLQYQWHDFVSKNNHNAITILALWAPVATRKYLYRASMDDKGVSRLYVADVQKIYLLDIHVFYTIMSAIVGFLLGARDRLGEIRSVEAVHRFFEKFPEVFMDKLHVAVPKRKQLLSSGQQAELNKLDASRFAPFWNEIVKNLREEDYISNTELDLLLMPKNIGGLPIVQWPLFLLASKVFLAKDIAVDCNDPQDELWLRISKDEYMQYAVEECFHSIKYILSSILDKEGHLWVQRIFDGIQESISKNNIQSDIHFSKLPNVIAKLVAVAGILLAHCLLRIRKLAEPRRIRLGSWNVGSLTRKLRELVDTTVRRGVDILCVQETKWRGQKAKEVEDTGFKLWYTGMAANSNGVGILINKSLKHGVADVKRRGDRIILVKLVVGDLVLNVINTLVSSGISVPKLLERSGRTSSGRKTSNVDQVKCIKDGVDQLLVKDEEIKHRWREYFDKLFNGENESSTIELDDPFDERRFVRRIQEFVVKEALKRMKGGKAMDRDCICIEIYREQKKEMHMVFIDFKKAYDKIPWNVMWWALEKHKVPTNYITLINDMYDNVVTSVRTSDGDTDDFPIKIGLHQGSAMNEWCMLFADDVVLVDYSWTGINMKLELWRQTLEKKETESADMKKGAVNAIQDLYEVVHHEVLFVDLSGNIDDWSQINRARAEGRLFNNLKWPNEPGLKDMIKRLHSLLTIKESAANVPKNLEASRRLQFFTNSLFMQMPLARPVSEMLSFSGEKVLPWPILPVFTPYYSETVLYSIAELQKKNEDGISTLFYLQKIYPDEWKNFLTRINRDENAADTELFSSANDILELRLWASYRGQTLARTVRGMMYYRKALMLQSYLERMHSEDLESAFDMAGLADTHFEYSPEARAQADLKFTYVVTCQIYGVQKGEGKPEAADIALLMQRNEALRIAYIDVVESVKNGKPSTEYYSKLVKADIHGKDKEIYSVKLPGNPKLGEGKPENQNHAVIFTRGNAVQTIDMNQIHHPFRSQSRKRDESWLSLPNSRLMSKQSSMTDTATEGGFKLTSCAISEDNYFEEALKMRNLLEEFSQNHGKFRPSILGVREHVFTGSVSSLASFMSNQETSFVTLGQRVLSNPLKVRMHYGHPDVFDRIFHITRGGISKASRIINISEDIFAGFNSTLRQGNITHHEYIQVGKGRDVGLNQIALFEGKVAGGNGEQVLSRDIYRLGQLFDFFRMLSFYVTTVGFYFCTMLTVLTVYIFLYGKTYLALSGVGESIQNRADIQGNKALSVALNTQFLFQIGVFTAIPMILGFILEEGVLTAFVSFITMQFQLCSIFFTFSLGTRTHYFGRTILHGGAKYRATGRGFVVRHIKFAENYRLYSRSHFVKGLEVALLLVIFLAYGFNNSGAIGYILLSISSWFMALSWLFAPYVFNPSGFEWQKVVEDFRDWTNWLFYRGGIGVKGEESWEAWWDEELAHIHTFRGRILETILSLRFFIFQYGVVYHMHAGKESTSLSVYWVSWAVLGGLFVLLMVFSLNPKAMVHFQLLLRLVKSIALLVVLAGLVVAIAMTPLTVLDVLASILAYVPTGWGILSIAVAWKPIVKRFGLWKIVRSLARLYDAGMGMIIFVPIAICSWFPFISTFQTRLLFNQAFSRGLEISLILAGNNQNAGI